MNIKPLKIRNRTRIIRPAKRIWPDNWFHDTSGVFVILQSNRHIYELYNDGRIVESNITSKIINEALEDNDYYIDMEFKSNG